MRDFLTRKPTRVCYPLKKKDDERGGESATCLFDIGGSYKGNLEPEESPDLVADEQNKEEEAKDENKLCSILS